MPSEARARIKINRLLERSGWRFFDSEEGPANITLEMVKRYLAIAQADVDKDHQEASPVANWGIKNSLMQFLRNCQVDWNNQPPSPTGVYKKCLENPPPPSIQFRHLTPIPPSSILIHKPYRDFTSRRAGYAHVGQ